MCVCLRVCFACVQVHTEGRRQPPDLELRSVVSHHMGPGTKLWSFARGVHAANCCDISPALSHIMCLCAHMHTQWVWMYAANIWQVIQRKLTLKKSTSCPRLDLTAERTLILGLPLVPKVSSLWFLCFHLITSMCVFNWPIKSHWQMCML